MSLAEGSGYKIVYRCSEEPALNNQPCCRQVAPTAALAQYPNTYETVAAEISAALKARIGVKPARVVVHPDGGLDTRSEHKSRRVIDERNVDYSI